jgi:hypothetical protein
MVATTVVALDVSASGRARPLLPRHHPAIDL